tara:strand:+ start:12693 stop:13232 length:540 start_codon:yes stop_codon:yes gene_type:complete
LRITKVYTKTGDDGTTSLSDGSRVKKNSLRIISIGSVDELNASLGMVLSTRPVEIISKLLRKIQNDLFNLGGEISTKDLNLKLVSIDDIKLLEESINELNSDLPALKEFIMPRGTDIVSRLHFSRTICRRAEVDLVNLSQIEKINSIHLTYLNRLSDYLFVSARYQNNYDENNEIFWDK